MKISDLEVTYDRLRYELFWADYWDYKACGCGHCANDLLNAYAFGDTVAYRIH